MHGTLDLVARVVNYDGRMPGIACVSDLATIVERDPALVWHAYPLGVLGADQTGSDRTCRATLQGVAEWLPHLVAVGADTLLLGPIFASQSHGYDTVTHRDIDDRLGAVADFDALVTAAAARNIGIVLDGAFAYSSRAFWRLADPDETVDPWFLRDATGQLVRGGSTHLSRRTTDPSATSPTSQMSCRPGWIAAFVAGDSTRRGRSRQVSGARFSRVYAFPTLARGSWDRSLTTTFPPS